MQQVERYMVSCYGFMPGKRTVDAIFIVMRMKEEYQKKDEKLYMCFVDMEKPFDRVPREVIKWAMRKKGLSEVMIDWGSYGLV